MLSVSDGTPPAVTQSFQIVVANVNDAPKFTSIAPTTASKGVLYNYAIVATDQDSDPLTITATTKPAWLTFTPGPNGTATLSGTPGQPQVGVAAERGVERFRRHCTGRDPEPSR